MNTYRRGAVYWWRGRFTGADAASRTIAFSLRVYDPVRARLLGVRLSAEAERLRRRVEAGMMDHESVGRSLGGTLEAGLAEPITWVLSEQAERSLAAFERERDAAQLPSGAMLERRPTKVQIDRVVAGFAEADALDLARASDEARLQVGFNEDGYALGIDNEPCADTVMAHLYRIIAHRGAGARLTAEDEAGLVREGRTRADIEMIRALVPDVAADERRVSWRLGPTRDAIAKALVGAGIDPALDTIHAVRRRVLLSRASMLQDLADQGRPDAEDMMPSPASPTRTAAALQPRHDPPRSELPLCPATPTEPVGAAVEASTADAGTTFLTLTEDFLVKKTRGMGDHSRRQYRAVARLFVKVAGTDDPRAMTQAHIGRLFDLLPKLPKSHGKSPADERRTLDEIIARGEAAVLGSGRPRTELIGLDPPTIDRYVTQLHALLKYMKGRGYRIGELDTLADMREKDDEADEDKRRAFTQADEITLFGSAPWSGCLSGADRLLRGTSIVHDSLYFLPLLAKYEVLSLSEAAGIMLPDIDDGASIPSIEIRMNELRVTLKTPTRSRRQPLHSELIRLGFIEYVRLLRSLGFTILFPDLRLRGEATPMSALFDKIWVPALDAALPLARMEKKTLHAFRKVGNTALAAIPSIVAPEVRLQLMGHVQTSVNGRHYVAPFPDDVKLAALQQLPITTAAMQPAKIKLAEAVQAYAKRPFADRNRLI